VVPAKALTDSNKELPSNSVESLDTFIYNSPFSSPRANARENTVSPAEANDFYFI